MIKVDFEFQTPHGVFRDALHLPYDHGMTDEQIDAMKTQRVDNWIAVVTALSAEETLPAEESVWLIATGSAGLERGIHPVQQIGLHRPVAQAGRPCPLLRTTYFLTKLARTPSP